jgi:hypothetical protein
MSTVNQNHDRQKRRCGGVHHEAWTPVARLHHRLGEPAISAVKNQGRGVNGGDMVAERLQLLKTETAHQAAHVSLV